MEHLHPSMPPENKWVDITEAAAILGVKPRTLYKRPYPFKFKEGRNVRFSLKGIHAYMAERERQALDRFARGVVDCHSSTTEEAV